MKKNNYRSIVLPQMGVPHSKTQYKPYFSSLPRKGKENPYPLEPLSPLPIQQATMPLDSNEQALVRLREKIQKLNSDEKWREHWTLYMSKTQIFTNRNFQWMELQLYLLRIIYSYAQQKQQLMLQLEKPEETSIPPLTSLTNLNSNNHQNSYFNKTQIYDQTYHLKLNSLNTSLPNESPMTINHQTQNQSCIKSIEKNSIKYKQEINSLVYKVSKLEKEGKVFQEKFLQNQAFYKNKIEELEQELTKATKFKSVEILEEKMKFESEIEVKKVYNQTLNKELKSLTMKYQKCQNDFQLNIKQLEQMKKKNEELVRLKRFRELWLMQNEQILILRSKIKDLLQEKDAYIKNNNALKQKLKELSKNFNYNYNISSEIEKSKQDVDEIIKQFRDWLKFIAVPRLSKGMLNNNTFFPEMVLPKTDQDYSSLLPKDDPTNYKLLRPNFFIYFEAYQNVIMAEKKFPQRKSMPPDFYLTIRGIMDAMFLHFSFNDNYSQWLSFPEFVSGFLEKFQINYETRKVNLRKGPCHSEEKINFLLNVFNVQAANSWQCDIFRNFLLEQHTLDEIYFYLDCRNHLFKGSQLNNNWGSADPVTFVKLHAAEEVISEKLKNYDREMIEKIKKFIDLRKKTKMGRDYIDSNFVLKLLMEVYSVEKVKSEKFFHHNFKMKVQGCKISYAEYFSFMEKNFHYLTSQQIARLYRQTYSLALGNITYKTIHYICSTKGLFIPLIKIKMLKKCRNTNKDMKQLNDLLYIDLQNCVSGIANGIEELGLEEVLGSELKINNLLRKSENYRHFKTIYQSLLLSQTIKMLKIKSILGWKYTQCINYDQLSRDDLRDLISHMLAIAHHTDYYIAAHRRRKQTREKAIKLLTHNFKIRIQQSLQEFSIPQKSTQPISDQPE